MRERMRTWQRWLPENDATLRRLRQSGTAYEEIAAIMGHTVPAVESRASELGLTTPKPPRWTKAEENRLISLLEDHHTFSEIAAILQRSELAIRCRCSRVKTAPSKANGETIHRTAQRCGIDSKTLTRWVAKGWLAAYSVGTGVFRVIEYDEMIRFLEDETHWHRWEPARITDLGLRAWAREMRQGVRFLTVGEAAKAMYLSEGAINRAIREGRLWGAKLGWNWLLRSDRLILLTQSRRKTGRPLSESEKAFILTWHGKRPNTWIGAQLGRSGSVVSMFAGRKQLTGVGRGYWRKVKAEETQTA